MKKIISLVIFLCLVCLCITGQDISFFHLSKTDGLSDNEVTAAVRDKNGLLWVGTTEGLNYFDGYTVKRFYKEEYPQLQNNNILRLACDEKNRLWIHFADKSITMLDENRKFHLISIRENGKEIKADFLLPVTVRGILFIKGSHLYSPDEKNPLQINRLNWDEDSSFNHNYIRINTWDNDKIICSGEGRLCLFDIAQLKAVYDFPVAGILAAARLNDDEALITTYTADKLCRINLKTKKIIKCYSYLKDQYGDELKIYPRSIYHLQDAQYIFTSPYAGLYMFDARNETLTRFKHDPLDPQSISANNTSFIFDDTTGYFFVTSNSGGLNFFNINYTPAKWKPFFQETSTGKIFDGYINCMAQSADGNLWLGGQNTLIKWNPRNNETLFIPYGIVNGRPLQGSEEIRSLFFDKHRRLWAGLNRFGVIIIDPQNRIIKRLHANDQANPLSANLINDIKVAPDGNIWIATGKGLSIIDPVNFEVLKEDSNIILKTLFNTYCRQIWFSHNGNAWISTKEGAYCLNLNSGSIKIFNSANGLRDNNIFSVIGDSTGNIYLGSNSGFQIIRDDSLIEFYTPDKGLPGNKSIGLLQDDSGKIWIGNNNALAMYDPINKDIVSFGQSSGLGESGFRENAALKAKDGTIYWGTGKGISYFNPNTLKKLYRTLSAIINTISTADTTYWIASNSSFTFPFSNNSLSFSYSAIELYGKENINYQYILEGADTKWKKTQAVQKVQYTGLAPGQYVFKVKASENGTDWVEAVNNIRFTINSPWWKATWFLTSAFIILLSASLYGINRRYKKKILRQEEIETERAVNYFATSMYEQGNVEDILWNVAKNCISRLHFEDCVIYLVEANRQVLVQKAAWGPKTTEENKIINPLEIPFGKGIVGNVALTGVPEIINDTSKDNRYIVDDIRRNSEICVPVLYNETVLGVIDSEHSRKNFFKQKHLSVLTTIASLCANKIIRLKAETEKQKAQMESLAHHRKAAEAQLKSLRLQMNPHFLFNSLNSIQQIILSGDEKAATLYLSKFSKMLRLVLAHSDKEKVTLKEELETLQLYVELEALRFNDSFHYEIYCDEKIDTEEIAIPTLLIQPFVENAIWHGLLHKEGECLLLIHFKEDNADNVVCIIEDNGIGRMASQKMESGNNHQSKGIKVAEERLKTYNRQHLQKSKMVIEDLTNVIGEASGTRVIITLPLLN